MQSCSEDPMDLGPFLENFVMKNPFRESSSPHLPENSDRNRLKRKHRPEKSTTNKSTDLKTALKQWLTDNFELSSDGRVSTEELLGRLKNYFPSSALHDLDSVVCEVFPGCLKDTDQWMYLISKPSHVESKQRVEQHEQAISDDSCDDFELILEKMQSNIEEQRPNRTHCPTKHTTSFNRTDRRPQAVVDSDSPTDLSVGRLENRNRKRRECCCGGNGETKQENKRLREELRKSNEQLLMLEEEMNARDFQLLHLSEDFFLLYEQFKRLASHFQLVLEDTRHRTSAPQDLRNGSR